MNPHTLLRRLAFAAALVAAASAPHAQALPSLAGQWESAAIENNGPVFATRSFTLTDKQWQVTYRAFADAQGRQPLFTLNVGGFYVVGGPSAKVAGAFEGIFPADHRHLTADSDAGVGMFAGMGCSLVKGQRTPLVGQGCGFVPGLMQAMGEYDLVAVQGGRLFWGDRAGDLTKARPEKLTPYPLVRK